MSIRELFLLLFVSHHAAEQYDHCYRVFGVPVCARCTGIYPIALVLLIPQILRPPVLDLSATDPWLIVLLPLPAVTEFIAESVGKITGTNWLRISTGIPLGIALSRMFARYFLNPMDPLFWGVVAVYGGACGLTAAFALRRRAFP